MNAIMSFALSCDYIVREILVRIRAIVFLCLLPNFKKFGI